MQKSKLRWEDDHENTVDSWNGRGCTFDFVDNSLRSVGLQKSCMENRSTHWRNFSRSLVASRAFKIPLPIKECIFHKVCQSLW